MQNPITLQEERKVWIVHQSLNGSTYYFNRATKKSQYEMPQCFKTTQQQLDHPEWKEYRTSEGKKFYYNASARKTSLFMPQQVKQYRMKKEEQKKRVREANGGKLPQQQKLTEAQENKRSFLTLLKHKGVQITTKWDSCMKMCEDDERWNLLKISDKKRYYNEYISELKRESQKVKKQKTEQNKALFLKMLRQNKNLNSEIKMHKVTFDFITDPRWRLLQGSQRQNVFQQHLEQLAQKEKEDIRQKTKLNTQMLKKSMEDDNIKCSTKWDQFCEVYKANPYFMALHPYDRITTFVDYILQMEKKEEEQQINQRKLKERMNRINFRKMLRDKLISGEVSYKIKWKAFVKEYKEDPNVLNMMDPDQPGTTAHQIFQHVLDQIRQSHKTIKAEIKHHFKAKGFRMNSQTTSDQFMSKLADSSSFARLSPLLKDYFFSYFLHKIKAKNNGKSNSHIQKQKQKPNTPLKDPKKTVKKQKKTIFKIFKHLDIDPGNRFSIDKYMDEIQKGLHQNNLQITRQNVLKYYLQFLSGSQEDRRKKKAHSYSSNKSHSDSQSQHDKKRKRKENDEEKQKLRKSVAAQDNDNEFQQQGQIKDEELQDRQKRKKNKAGKKSRKRSKSSSSDSD